jgi:uncharacterized protein YceK
MKNIIIALSMAALFSGVSGCATVNSTQHAEDHARHQAYLEQLYTNSDPEYIDDCFEYEELKCEFE